MAALSKALPAAAERLAWTLFFTPRRGQPSARSLDTLASAESSFLEVLGLRIRVHVWGSPGRTAPAVYLLHGWSGQAAQMTSFVGPLLSAGFRVVALDAPAHGASEGRQANLVMFARALEAAVARYGPARAVVAHSLGGSAAVVALTLGVPIGRLVLIGAPHDATSYFGRFLTWLGAPEEIGRRVRARLEASTGIGWDHIAISRSPARGKVPALVLHDEDDAEVSWHDAEVVAREWPGSTLVATRGLGHRRILRDAAVVAAVVDFIRDGAGAVASPATTGGAPCSCEACALERELWDREARWDAIAARAA